MVYLTMKADTPVRLHFTRQPGLNSWGLLVGFSAVGLGIGYYGNDPMWLKLIYFVLGAAVGMCCLEDWEECDFNKETGEIRLRKSSIWDVLAFKQSDVIVAQVDDVSDVGIREEATSFVGKSYQVVLTLSAGMTVAITDALTFGFPSEHQAIAKKIRTFLDLAEVAGNDYLESSDDEAESTEDSDFECIDKSELVDEICPEEEAGNQEEVGEDIKAADS